MANDVNYIYLLEESLDVPPAFETQQDTLKTINFKNENEGEDVEIRQEWLSGLVFLSWRRCFGESQEILGAGKNCRLLLSSNEIDVI